MKAFPVPLTILPMEARLADKLPSDGAWQYEPKWDGFRCLAFKIGKKVHLLSKSGKPLDRYFPEVVARIASLKASEFVLDGELDIELDFRLDFEALQMRLHPAASRILKLSKETPARFMVFDMLVAPEAKSIQDRPLSERRILLEKLTKAESAPDILLSPRNNRYSRRPKMAFQE